MFQPQNLFGYTVEDLVLVGIFDCGELTTKTNYQQNYTSISLLTAFVP